MEGRTVSHYRVRRRLGGGGMGVVYEAEDTRLGRAVALKFLSDQLPEDHRARARFEREARAASALDHPHICTVFDIGEHEGRPFIVMERLEGCTFKRRIEEGGFDTDQLLSLAVQLADGLAAAHTKGIAHRDVKPTNIFLTTRGDAKILDFGLAKHTDAPDPARSGSQTASADELTRPGTAPGTLAYMSPEQALGKEVDHRTDLFSLGVVLYEMATRTRPFRGETQGALVDEILHATPASAEEANPKLDGGVARIIDKCLEKDRELRYQSARELLADLKRVQRDRSSDPASRGRAPAAPRRSARARWVAATLGVCAVGVAGAWLLWNRNPPQPGPVRVTPFTSDGGLKYAPRLSPDGERVAYNWAGSADDNWDVYVKGVGQGALPLRLTNNPAADWAPAWSPDGRQIAFVREIDESGAIYTVPSSGGQEHKLIDLEGPVWQADQVTFISALTWSPDGGSLAYAEKRSETEPARIVRVSLATLERLPVTSPPEGAFGDLSPEFSPDGRQLAFSRQASRSWGTQDLWIQPAQGGRGRQLTHDGYGWCSNLSWTPDQRNIVFSTSHAFTGGNIFRVALSGGAPEPLAGVGSNVAFPSVRGGRMAHVLHTSSARQLWRIPGRRAAAALRRPERLSTSNWWDGSPAYSPDGRRIAFESDRGGVQNIWTSRGDGADPAQVTAFERPAGTPRWSPDGRRIVFDSSKAGGWDIYVAEVEGGIPRRLTDDPASDNVATFSRDGRGIYFSSDRTGQRQVWRMPVEGGSAVQVTRGGGLYAEESWDGRYVYHTKDAGGGRTAVWRVPVAGGDEVEVLPGLNSWADWTLARGGIYYLRSREVLRGRRSENEIRYLDFATGQTRSLFRKDGAFDLYGLAVSPDEESILFGEHPLPQSELLLVENFR